MALQKTAWFDPEAGDAALDEFRASEEGSWGEEKLLALVSSLDVSYRLIDVISDQSAISAQQAETLTRIALLRDASFVTRLAKTLALGKGPELAPLRIVRVLEVLSKVADISRLRPVLVRLVTHDNLFVRSKASLILARSHGSSGWIRKQYASDDPRIRANAIESGWGLQDDEYRRICRDALNDVNNRVRGNALIGLYRCGAENWAARMAELSRHESENFRITAAWAMGMTGEACFLSVLQELAAEGHGQVRWHALRAISRIRKGQD
jgi:FOG: HEAT repeat